MYTFHAGRFFITARGRRDARSLLSVRPPFRRPVSSRFPLPIARLFHSSFPYASTHPHYDFVGCGFIGALDRPRGDSRLGHSSGPSAYPGEPKSAMMKQHVRRGRTGRFCLDAFREFAMLPQFMEKWPTVGLFYNKTNFKLLRVIVCTSI